MIDFGQVSVGATVQPIYLDVEYQPDGDEFSGNLVANSFGPFSVGGDCSALLFSGSCLLSVSLDTSIPGDYTDYSEDIMFNVIGLNGARTVTDQLTASAIVSPVATSPVPLPASAALFGAACLGLGVVGLLKRTKVVAAG